MIKKLIMGFCILLSMQTVSFAGKWDKEALEREAQSWNKGLPQMLDEDTQLFQVEAKPSRLILKHKIVSMDRSKLAKGEVFLINKIPFALPRIVCTETPFREIYLNQGVVLTYSYYDKNGLSLVDVTITKKVCDAIH